MAEISSSSFSETDASNNGSTPDGWPEGQSPSSVNDCGRAMMGAIKRFWNRINGTLTSGGGTTAYTLTPTVALGSYVTGERFTFKCNATSTGAATLNISALGAKNIYKMANAAVAATVAGDLVANMMYEVVYDGTQFILLNPSTAGADVLTTRGDIIIRGATIPQRLAVGAANRVLKSDGTDPAWGQVTGPMIAMGSDAQGDILYHNGTSYARLAAGTSGQFLKTQGAGANPTWGDVAAGTVTTIASGSLPAATTQSFTSIPATYSSLHLKIVGASSNTATRHPLVRVSTNNGSSYDATAGNYSCVRMDPGGAAISPTAEASVAGDLGDAAAASTWDIDIIIQGYQGGPRMQYTYRAAPSGSNSLFGTGFYLGSTSAINAIQILWSGSGNFDAGTYALYGIT